MVGKEDIAVFFLDILTSFDLDTEQEEPKGALRPELRQVICHHIGVSKEAGDDNAGGDEYGDDNEKRQSDTEGVNLVEDVENNDGCFVC